MVQRDRMMPVKKVMMATTITAAVATNVCFSIILFFFKKTTNYTNDANGFVVFCPFVSVIRAIRS